MSLDQELFRCYCYGGWVVVVVVVVVVVLW